MSGYGDAALHVTPFTSQLEAAARAQSAQTDADYNRQSSPLRLEALTLGNDATRAGTESTRESTESTRINNAGGRLRLGTLEQATEEATRAHYAAQIHDVASSIDPDSPTASQDWDRRYQALVDAGNEDARQYIGQYRRELHARLAAAGGPTGPLAAAFAQPGADATGAPAPTLSDAQRQHLDVSYQGHSDDELRRIYGQQSAYEEIVQATLRSSGPAAVQTWNDGARRVGHPELAVARTPEQAQALASQAQQWLGPQYAYLSERLGIAGTGGPAPAVPESLQNVPQVGLVGVRPGPTGEAQTRTVVPEPQRFTYAGVDASGHPVQLGDAGGEQTHPNVTISQGRYGVGGGSGNAFERRVATIESGGYTHRQAVDLASGIRPLSPQQMERMADVSARSRADTDALNESLGPADREALYHRYREEELANLRAAGSDTPGPGGAPGGAPGGPAPAAAAGQLPAPALAQLRSSPTGWVTFRNGQTWRWINGRAVRVQR